MRDIEKQYAKLSHQLTMLHFASELDFNACDKIKKEMKALESQRYGWCVELSRTYSGNTKPSISYLTSDSILCHSDEPTYFETMKEAQEYLFNADLDLSEYGIRFI